MTPPRQWSLRQLRLRQRDADYARSGNGANDRPNLVALMPQNDPTNTGGLFIGRRPGTAPLRYRDQPVPAGKGRRRVDAVLAGALLVLETLLLATLWGPQPAGWLWIGSRLSHTQAPSGGPYMIVFFGIVCSIIAMSWVLSWLNRLYVRITGSEKLLPHRYLPAWRKSLSDERETPHGMTVLETVILSSVLLAGVAMAVWFFIAAGSPLPSQ